jgi:hypothetical protein
MSAHPQQLGAAQLASRWLVTRELRWLPSLLGSGEVVRAKERCFDDLAREYRISRLELETDMDEGWREGWGLTAGPRD